MIRVGADTEMEPFLSGDFDEVPLRRNLVSFWSLNGSLNGSLPSVFIVLSEIWTYLLAQMRAASSASEDSCSYSFETMCTHSGNSSTLARLRPRSKMRILGSGTPRLKRDFGYGCHVTLVSIDSTY